METQNVTVSLPVDLVREARHLAVDRGMSLSKFVASLIEEKITWRRDYEIARQRQLRMMAEAEDRGTNGVITWTRDELHER
jgi:hypothetical protein